MMAHRARGWQGEMTSPSLAALLRASVAAAHPEIRVDGRAKEEILEDVMASHGWTAVLAISAGARRFTDHPVVRALLASPTPVALIERWMLLERFGHNRNRVERVGAAGADRVAVRHVAVDGGPIAAVNDLFIWGLLLALLELAGTRSLQAWFGGPAEGRLFHDAGRPSPGAALPASTQLVTFAWEPAPRTDPMPASDPPADRCEIQARLHGVLRADLLARWTADRAARRVGLSARSLQRSLQAEGTTFTATLQRARIAAAEALVGDERLSLAEIAFCAGFADQSHFTRTFRRYADVPPSALRQALRAKDSQGDAS